MEQEFEAQRMEAKRLKVDRRPQKRILEYLNVLYDEDTARRTWEQLRQRLEGYRQSHPQLLENVPPLNERLTEKDVFLVTYGDQVQEPGKSPLQTLRETLSEMTWDFLTGVHLLPFYPYSSDDGFSVIKFRHVNPRLGTWGDIHELGQHFRLMFDAVINHTSRHSAWFKQFLKGIPPYTDCFIVASEDWDLSRVVRPRTTPLLSPVETTDGIKEVWTTFSADQVDLNYRNPFVLLEVIDVLLDYVAHGAEILRLDAIAFLWKEPGTSCVHLPQTHAIIKTIRAVMDIVAPGVLLITETNVPHKENVSYFGDGTDEAQMVYQFSLPPLTLHAFHSGDATILQEWAADLNHPSDLTTFFNFLASHDGIGVRPAEGILSRQQILELVAHTHSHGGFVTYKSDPGGGHSPYELNTTYFDSLNNPNSEEPEELQIRRFMSAQAILLSMQGVPGIYVHTLFGSRNWRSGVAQSGGHYRAINRQKFARAELEAELADVDSRRHRVFQTFRRLIRLRTADAAFHPNGPQEVIAADPGLFSFMRTSPDGRNKVLCIQSVADRTCRFRAGLSDHEVAGDTVLNDLLTGTQLRTDAAGELDVEIPPYGVLWLKVR